MVRRAGSNKLCPRLGVRRRRTPSVLLLPAIIVAISMMSVGNVSASTTNIGQSSSQFLPQLQTGSLSSPQLPTGDWVTITCSHGAILLNGSLVCHDQTFTAELCGDWAQPLVCYYTIRAVPDCSYAFSSWTASGDSYLGNYPNRGTVSYSNPSGYWATGGYSHYAGTLTLNLASSGYCVPVVIKLPWGPGGAYLADATVNYYLITENTTLQLTEGQSVPISFGQLYSVWNFQDWSAPSGVIQSPNSPSTSLVPPSGGASVSLQVKAVTQNWGGYAVLGPAEALTYVAGSWVQPTISCAASSHYTQIVSTWAGLDGVTPDSSTVEQAGTTAYCLPNSTTVTYYAWYEWVPSGAVTITSIPVQPGHVYFTSVWFNSVTGSINITFKDITVGTVFSVSQSRSNQELATAECTVELPSGVGVILPTRGTAYFGSQNTGAGNTCYAGSSSAQLSPFGSLYHYPIYLSVSGDSATPSSLSAGSFSVGWSHG